MSSLSLGILVERRYRTQAQPAGLVSALQARGHQVILIDPESASYEPGNNAWLDQLDLLVVRGRSLSLLYLLSWAEARGIPTVNRHVAIKAVHNKAEMAVALANRNVPTPRTFLGPIDRLASQVPASCYPAIFKPIFGDNARGLQLVQNAAEAAALQWPESTALVQYYLPSDGCDVKLYGIGERIWAVRKPSPFWPNQLTQPRSNQRLGVLPATSALQELGYQCGKLFGLELYGVDCIDTPEGLMVIEVNDFPNYTGIPNINAELASYITRRLPTL